MSTRILAFIAIGFGILLIVQALMGGWLLYLNIGLTPTAIHLYYTDKSFHGLVEVILPHLLFMSVALVALTHFLTFIPTLSEKRKSVMIHLLFGFFIVDQLSPFGIALGFSFFAYIKLLSFILFEMGLVLVWFVLFQSVLHPLAGNKG